MPAMRDPIDRFFAPFRYAAEPDFLDRAAALFALVWAMGRPVKAGHLCNLTANFRACWKHHRHLLRPLWEYRPWGRGVRGF